jgi:hypothetical protein
MSEGELILYSTEDGAATIGLRAVDGTVWLSQIEMAELFQISKQNVSLHVRNIIAEGELDPDATVKEYLTVQTEGPRQVKRSVTFYRLEIILAVGYRVRSPRGIQFRRWATTVLSEYLVKGFAMDDSRLKQAEQWDYFDEWLARIRDIRASEKRFYQKVRDLYATAVDYDKSSEQAKVFFKKVQNKMLWAVTGKTAAELIESRSDPDAPNMGVTSWKGSVVRKGDVGTAKNYLKAEEVEELNRIVVMYLDYAEDQAKRRRPVTMAEWSDKLDAFLSFNERDVLTHAGRLRMDVAQKLAVERFETFDTNRRAAEAPVSMRKGLEHGQRFVVDTHATVRISPASAAATQVLSVRASWPDEPGAADHYSYHDTTAIPSIRLHHDRVITYQLIDFGDFVAYENMQGIRGRPTSGGLGALFGLLGTAEIRHSRFAVAEDQTQVNWSEVKKLFSFTALTTITPDGVAERGEYTVFVPGAQEGETVTAYIKNVSGNLAFARRES